MRVQPGEIASHTVGLELGTTQNDAGRRATRRTFWPPDSAVHRGKEVYRFPVRTHETVRVIRVVPEPAMRAAPLP